MRTPTVHLWRSAALAAGAALALVACGAPVEISIDRPSSSIPSDQVAAPATAATSVPPEPLPEPDAGGAVDVADTTQTAGHEAAADELIIALHALAEQEISRTLTEALGGSFTVVCDELPSAAVGTTTSCTATDDADGRRFELLVTVTEPDGIDFDTVDLASPEYVTLIEDELAAQLGQTVAGVVIDCGDSYRVVDDQNSFDCTWSRPDGRTGEATITVDDFDTGDYTASLSGITLD